MLNDACAVVQFDSKYISIANRNTVENLNVNK